MFIAVASNYRVWAQRALQVLVHPAFPGFVRTMSTRADEADPTLALETTKEVVLLHK